MSVFPSPIASPEGEERALGVVICGSFRRGLTNLREDHSTLVEAGCTILSPIDIEFVRETDGFVFASHEQNRPISEIERDHLSAVRSADFVWLHAPDGYLGPSGAFELGTAASAGVPVFTSIEPRDVSLRDFVKIVSSPREAAAICRAQSIANPGEGLRGLQVYYDRVAHARGWASESAVESMVLLTEEVGELARAVREHVGLARHRGLKSDPSEELADVQLYVAHLANVLKIDLAEAVSRKEAINARRFSLSDAQTA